MPDPRRRHPKFTFAASEPLDDFAAYALALVGDYVGAAFEQVDVEGDTIVDLLYGNDEQRPCRLRIPRVARYSVEDVPRDGGPGPGGPQDPFPFDVFAALRFWLADEGNAHAAESARDERGRLLAAHSAQERLGLTEVPVVNLYLLALRQWLEARLSLQARRLLAPGTRCALLLTHDVDLPIDPHDPRHDLRLVGRAVKKGVRPVRAMRHAARTLARTTMSVAKREGRRWVFDEVVEEEAHRGFTSVFFFAATNRYDALGEDADVAYDVRAMRFRELFRSLSARGAEVGLHVGYRARSDPDLIARERQLLEDAAGTPVRGSRHHYLMSDPFWSTLEGHARAGLVYDTSVCFNEAPGYRLGVALPFRPWNPELTRAVSTAQIPTVALDSALLGEGGTADSAVAHVERLLDGLKAAEGIAALDWHDSRSFPANRAFASSGEAYLRILDLLEADPEVSVQTSSELAGLALGPM